MNNKKYYIVLLVVSLLLLTYLLIFNEGTKSSLTILELREKHANFLANSPFKKTLKLSKSERKALQLPPNKYYEREWELTMNPATGKPEPFKIFEIQDKRNNTSRRVPGDETLGNEWIDRGPNNVGGRTRVVLFDPIDASNKRVFAGGVSGGLWKNEDITNANSSWTLVSGVPSNMNISCITVDPNDIDKKTWYIGTGEQYTFGAAVGNGVYKTIDGGTTWTHLTIQLAGGGTSGSDFAGIYYINDIVAWDKGATTDIFIGVGTHVYGDAANPTNWLGFQNAGLYKSSDGGASWSRIESPNIPLSGSYQYIPNDFEISPNNTLWMGTIGRPGTSNNGGGAVLKSNDGISWTLVRTLSNSNRVELAVSKTNANKMYALTQGTTTAGPHIYATSNAFTNITELAKPNDADNGIPANDFTRGQAFYDLVIEVDPTNDAVVYVGGIDLFRTSQGINTNLASEWVQISKWSNNENLNTLDCSYVHADQHAFTFRPEANNEAVIGCDGGVFYATSLSTAATNDVISSRNKDYNVTQFYYGGYGQNTSNELILAGAQDNGSQFINGASAGANASFDLYGGDGAYSTIDKDGNYMIASYVYGNHYYFSLPYLGTSYTIDNNDDEGDFINQAGLDHNLNIMYSNGTNGSVAINRYILGSSSSVKNKLTNSLLTSSPTAFKVSPFTTTSSTLLVGTENGKLFQITNANNVNLSLVKWKEITGSLFAGSISAIEFGETENDIFVTFHNYGVSSIWYSSNGGASWVNKEGNLPDMPVKSILQNPLAKNEVIVGTELGIWVSKNFNEANPTWISSYNGMRDVKVVDLDLRTDDHSILATTFGRGVFTGQFTNATNSTYTLSSTNSVVEVCNSSANAIFNFDYTALGGYSNSTNISVSGVPSGATSSLSASTFNSSDASFTLTINNIGAVTPGKYVITVTGIGGPTVSKELLLVVKSEVGNVSTTLPVDGANQISINSANLTWLADTQATSYDVVIASDAGFNTIIETTNTPNNYYTIGTILNLSTVYYWKVRAKNDCNIGVFSEIKRFITAANNNCDRAPDVKIANVPINDGETATSTINIANSFTISKVKVSVDITHTYIADFNIKLISPPTSNKEILLFDGSCGDTDGLEVTFDDEAASAIVCGSQPVTGIFTPIQALSGLNGIDALGNWTIEIYDAYSGDIGTLNSWSLEFCYAENIVNSTFTNSPLTVGTNSTYVLNQAETKAYSDGSTDFEQVFMLAELPTKGDIRLSNVALSLGETFNQNDIATGKITYVNSASANTTDQFKLDITNATSGFLPNQQVNITIDSSLGIDDQFFERTGTSIFPTVSDGQFFISSSQLTGKTKIEVFTISGQPIYKNSLNFAKGNIEPIEIFGVSSGVYIVRLTSDNAQGSKRILIK
ncbi:proprotein convertase P-domain-containing protein [Lutibacter sp.]|uniref:proprotein convertase P-domain-containing protein n=1 Tax=Lutibacter sp. TaxID=1925666 RepID=UPI001A317449|nr:proprotein convertase P-domain-containing protein [Lutibacter sp.]MBI9041051.1 proprotein convertase P-domain-containing protein [Lutibacter sp.]